jgi:hypothetical protein
MAPIIALLFFAVVSQDIAQISGIVQDETGQPVAAAEVILNGPNIMNRTVADDRGRFVFDAVPAGRYLLDFSQAGFFRVSNYSLDAKPGANEITVTLNHEYEVHSQLDVVANPHEIVPQQMRHEDQIVGHEIRENPVPSSHDLQNSLPALPGVVQDNTGELHVAGARVQDTLYTLDGFEINDPATGVLDARVNVDAVREAEVSTGRYGAQFANAGSGVLALQTDTGDDHWRFGITNFIPALSTQRGVHLGNFFPRINFSGPLQKGRAWFSDGASIQHSFNLVQELPPGSDISEEWAGDNLLRGQYNLTPVQSLQGNFLSNVLEVSRSGLNAFAPAATTTDIHSHRYFVSGRDQITITNGLIDIGAASDANHAERLPQGSQTFVLTPTGPQGNYFSSQTQDSHRWQGRGDMTLYGRQWRGAHEIQLGVNVDQTHLDQNSIRHPVEVRNSTAVLVRQSFFLGNTRISLSNTQNGAYAQDAWHLRSNLILQSSFRIDRNNFIGRTLHQPRFILNWIPRPNSKLSVGWGIYYQPVYLSLLGQQLDQTRLDILNGAPLVTTFSFAEGLHQPYFQMSSAEWQHQWSERTSSSVHLMERRQYNGLAYENVSGDPARRDLQLNDHRKDRYESVQTTIRHSLRGGSEVMVDYTYSRARSNQVIDYSVEDLVLAEQAGGALLWDTPHRLISRGALQTKLWGLLFSYFLEYHTGFPFSAVDSLFREVGSPNTFRFPAYFSLNIGAEKRVPFRRREWAVRLSVINITAHHNFNAVINNIDAPNFGEFAGGQSRAFTARIRLVGRK